MFLLTNMFLLLNAFLPGKRSCGHIIKVYRWKQDIMARWLNSQISYFFLPILYKSVVNADVSEPKPWALNVLLTTGSTQAITISLYALIELDYSECGKSKYIPDIKKYALTRIKRVFCWKSTYIATLLKLHYFNRDIITTEQT